MEFADWTRAYVMVGDSPAGWKEVLLAEDGSMYALLQGMTPDEELRTVLLDDEGRMSAFVIDSTDAWGQMLSVGNAELAARLGSPVFYHQSGRVQLVESWENGLGRWNTAKSGNDASVALCPTSSESGGYSVKMVAGSTDAWRAQLLTTTGVLAHGRVGLALSFACSEVFESLMVRMTATNGSDLWQASVLLDDDTNTVEVQTGLTTWASVGTLMLLDADVKRYNHLKFVLDFDTGYYDQIYLNGRLIDASGEQSYHEHDAGGGYCGIELKLIGNDGDNDEVYVDNIIMTTGEP